MSDLNQYLANSARISPETTPNHQCDGLDLINQSRVANNGFSSISHETVKLAIDSALLTGIAHVAKKLYIDYFDAFDDAIKETGKVINFVSKADYTTLLETSPDMIKDFGSLAVFGVGSFVAFMGLVVTETNLVERAKESSDPILEILASSNGSSKK